MNSNIFARRFFVCFFVCFLVFCCFSRKASCAQSSGTADKQTSKNIIPKGFKVGYVDVRKVFDSCTQTKEATNSLKKEIELRQAALAKEEEEITGMQKELKEKEIILSESEKQKRQKQIEERIVSIQKTAQLVQQELSSKEKELTETIIGLIQLSIKETAKEDGFNLILEKDSVLYCEDVVDLTDKIIKKINDQK